LRVKRAKEKKTRRAKTIKQLTSMGRRHLLGVRVVMKNMVYVVGMKIPGSGDEVSLVSTAMPVFAPGRSAGVIPVPETRGR
jgi:hypothetical protein